LLIPDDFGLQPLDAQARSLLMDIMEDRHQKHASLIASQIPVKNRHDASGKKTMADALLDRMVHHALRVELYGESLKKKKLKMMLYPCKIFCC
jgi:DNA replication protein DnaC